MTTTSRGAAADGARSGRTASGDSAPGETGPEGTASEHTGSGQTDSGQANSGHTGSGHTDSGQANSGHTGSGHTDSGQANSGHTGSGQADSGHTGSGQADSGLTDFGRTDSGDTSPSVSPLRVGLLVSRAQTAARSGELDEALRLLKSAADPAVGGHRDVLDLLARVHAQRGELTEAAAHWHRIQERHPEDPAAAAGLARIERLGRAGPRAALARHRTRTALAAAVCAVAAITAGTVALTDATTDRQPARHSAAPAAQTDQMDQTDQTDQTEQAERIAQRIAADREAELARQRAREQARKSGAADTLARALRAPGLRPVAHGDSVEVAFTEGLFAEGDRLTPTGASQLTVLGNRLTDRQARIEIHGHAATVPGAPRSGGSVLALWRALVAARELSAASGKPLTAFTTTSADQQDAPYDDATRNRTVTVVITPE
ncbi:hypothetical protein OHT21_30675 [Streptomyces sp. NBC_00286]|nr:tetratricopeptide repeat protein [Streptomyces sp. NBC_00286]